MKSICTKAENSRAINKFRANLAELSSAEESLEWGFPSGERYHFFTYTLNTTLGAIQVGIPDKWSSRIPHLIRFVKDQGPPSPDVEINIPLTLDRKVSGLYVDNGDDVLLCSRGLFTAFRGKIKKDTALNHFHQWIQVIEDSGQESTIIPVCSITSESMAEDLASFTQAVITLKESFKNSEIDKSIGSKPPWGTGAEFEGNKSLPTTTGSDYEYKHGPLCNQLMQYLSQNLNSRNYVVRKNNHVDVALVDPNNGVAKVIFEVKTASLPSNQIYTAIGQLAFYKHRYGNENTALYVVLPLECKSKETEEVLRSVNLSIIYKYKDKFIDTKGSNFSLPR